MAASDARPVPIKNTAFRVSFDIENVTNGALITTWADMDSEVSLDGGAFADCTNEATEIGTTGIGYLDPTAAEMNADTVIVKVTVSNANARVVRLYFNPVEDTDIPVNSVAISGSTVAADNVEANIGNLDAAISDVPTAAENRTEMDTNSTKLTAIYDNLSVVGSDASSAASAANAASAKFGGITTAAGNQLDDWLLAIAADGATAPNAMSSAGFDPTTDSLEAIRNNQGSGGASAADVWTYGTRTLTAVDSTVNIVNPFDTNSSRITIGYGEDRSTGSTNGALALTTTTSINLSTAGGTIYFAVREKQKRATESAVFTLTGTATAALAYTVSLTSATTRLLLPGTYLWTAWHVASGVYTDLGHGDYVVADLVTPTV